MLLWRPSMGVWVKNCIALIKRFEVPMECGSNCNHWSILVLVARYVIMCVCVLSYRHGTTSVSSRQSWSVDVFICQKTVANWWKGLYSPTWDIHRRNRATVRNEFNIHWGMLIEFLKLQSDKGIFIPLKIYWQANLNLYLFRIVHAQPLGVL